MKNVNKNRGADMSKVLIIGGGPAGMMAAYAAANNGNEVHILEKNEKLGKKLFVTGKGRCNITNASDLETIFQNIVSNQKFMYSALYTFTNENVIDFFEESGIATKIERGNRVFPVSDKSSDVIYGLSRRLSQLGVKTHLHREVSQIITKNGCFEQVVLKDGERIKGDSLIIATGGLSYPATGSTGDGIRFAKKIGHTIVHTSPALVPLTIKEEYANQLQGLSLKNVKSSVCTSNKVLYSDFGEMLFTHYGVSGPIILSASSFISKLVRTEELKLKIDLKPALTNEQLDKRILREFDTSLNKSLKNALDSLLPKKMIPVMIDYCRLNPDKKIHEVTKEERGILVNAFKAFTLTITGVRGYNEAIITQGGVSVKEVEPGTMESKKVKGVYFAGEVLDLDALTGGYNLQIAWSTGYLAGLSV